MCESPYDNPHAERINGVLKTITSADTVYQINQSYHNDKKGCNEIQCRETTRITRSSLAINFERSLNKKAGMSIT